LPRSSIWQKPTSHILKLQSGAQIAPGSEGFLTFCGFDPESHIGKEIGTLIPQFHSPSPMKLVLTQDGKVCYFFMSEVQWGNQTFVLTPYDPMDRELELLRLRGDYLSMEIRNHPAVQPFAVEVELGIKHFNQVFSNYYDLLVRESKDHNSFSWNVPASFAVQCPISCFVGILGALQSYRLFMGTAMNPLSLNLVPFSSNQATGFKLLAEFRSSKTAESARLDMACYYLWLEALNLGFTEVEMVFGKNGSDEMSFTFLEPAPADLFPRMLVAQSESWYSDRSLWLLRHFQHPGIRFFESLEHFIQTALCTDPLHSMMVLDMGSFSRDEMKLRLTPIKRTKALSIIGTADHIARVPTYWSGPTFIQTGRLTHDLDRLFSFFSKREKSYRVQVGRL